jgi:hypothetical protein
MNPNDKVTPSASKPGNVLKGFFFICLIWHPEQLDPLNHEWQFHSHMVYTRDPPWRYSSQAIKLTTQPCKCWGQEWWSYITTPNMPSRHGAVNYAQETIFYPSDLWFNNYTCNWENVTTER